MTTRDTLKTYFVKGAIPKASEFAELIDSVLIKDEDNLSQVGADPLSIKAATDGRLLNFYNAGQKQPTWQLTQKQDAPAGLSINSVSGDSSTSRLFIDNTGNIGLGTTETGNTKLTVAGDTRLNGKVDVTGATTLNGALTVKGATTTTTLEGALTIAGLLKANIGAAITGGATIDNLTTSKEGNVGIGTSTPKVRLTVQTPNDYDGDTLRLEVKREPAAYYLNLKSVTTPGVVRWVFDQINNGTTYSNVLTFDRGKVGIGTIDPSVYKLEVAGDTNVVGNLNVTGTIKQTSWVEVTDLRDNWRNFGGGYSTAAYYKDSLGIVHLKGFVTGGNVDWDGSRFLGMATMFTLPAGFTPSGHRTYIVATGSATEPIKLGRVTITSDGKVVPNFGENYWFSLDGITFRAA